MIDTPIPEKENGSRLPRLPNPTWAMLGKAVSVVASIVLATYFLMTNFASAADQDATAKIATDLVTQTALNQEAVNVTREGLKELKADVKDVVHAVQSVSTAVQILDANVRAIAAEAEIPRSKLARPPRDRP